MKAFETRRRKDTKFFFKTKLLIIGKYFQPFERIELIEPFEQIQPLKPLERVENIQPLQPHKPLLLPHRKHPRQIKTKANFAFTPFVGGIGDESFFVHAC